MTRSCKLPFCPPRSVSSTLARINTGAQFRYVSVSVESQGSDPDDSESESKLDDTAKSESRERSQEGSHEPLRPLPPSRVSVPSSQGQMGQAPQNNNTTAPSGVSTTHNPSIQHIKISASASHIKIHY